jgi:hypothetical protein
MQVVVVVLAMEQRVLAELVVEVQEELGLQVRLQAVLSTQVVEVVEIGTIFSQALAVQASL